MLILMQIIGMANIEKYLMNIFLDFLFVLSNLINDLNNFIFIYKFYHKKNKV